MKLAGRPAALAGCTALAALFSMLGSGPAQSQEQSRRELLNPLASVDPATLRGFLGRPLFSPSRRPPLAPATVPASTDTSAPVSPPPALRLVGVIRTPKESIAQVVQGTGTQRLSLRIGDFMEDWIVASIEASALTLKQGDRNARFSIFTGNSAAGAQPGAAAATEASPLDKSAPPRRRAPTREQVQGFFGK